MGKTSEDFKNSAIGTRAFGNAGARAATRFRSFTVGMKGFKMEMLGVMFFGMAMSRMFSKMLSPVSKIFSVFELWSTTLAVVFLPVMELLFPILLSFMSWLMDLPEPAKIFIGLLTIMGVIVGTLLFLFGTLVLGLGSLGIALGAAAAGFGVAMLVIIAIAAVITGVILVVRNWGSISDWVVNKWKNATMAIGDFFKNMVNNITGFLEGLINGMIDKVNKLIDKINNVPGINIDSVGNVSFATDFSTGGGSSQGVSQFEQLALGGGGQSIMITNNYNGFTSQDLLQSQEESEQRIVSDFEKMALGTGG